MIDLRIAARVDLDQFGTQQFSNCESPQDADPSPSTGSISPWP
jgi:hypothetical protein